MRRKLGILLPLLLLSSCDGRLIGHGLVEPDAEANVPPLALQPGQQLVAACGASKGYSYFPELGIITEEDAGFQEDGISEGYFYLLKQPDSTYDVIFRDASQRAKSAIADGAIVEKLRAGTSDAAFAVHYKGGAKTVEVYTFYIESGGKQRFTTLVSKGAEAPIAKSGLLAGSCDHLALGA
jgi:hypothetical protein